MDGVKKNFGFGCMRLPMLGDEVDVEQVSRMVDTFLENGFNYFDTAHGYLDGKSETALKTCLTSRHDRSEYIITDKLTKFFFEKEEDIRPFFETQLELVGVEYFDYYLMHAQSAEIFEYFKAANAYETAFSLKAEGKIRHVGISFHDKAEVLDRILTEYPEIEVVQIQFNYLDYEDPAIESKRCYEVCRKHNKPVIVMEPVKGGSLVNLPNEAAGVLSEIDAEASQASFAIRFAASHDGIEMVLSGMSTLEQMADNISFMKDFVPFTEEEYAAVHKVSDIIHGENAIPCTACRYCVAGCPEKILIPDLFACMNTKKIYGDWNADYYYNVVHTAHNGKASDCIRCGRCELACPQHLKIRDLLVEVAGEFEGK